MRTKPKVRLKIKSVIIALIVLILLVTSIVFIVKSIHKPNDKKELALQQTDSAWCDYPYGNSTLGVSGCGVLATINAVRYLNGNTIDIYQFTDWASINEYGESYGSNWTIALDSVAVFGEEYDYTYTEYYTFGLSDNNYYPTETQFDLAWNTLIEHLQNGDVAIALVQGHFISIVDYDSSTECVLVLDSYASNIYRNTTKYGDWKSYNDLNYNSSEGKSDLKLRGSFTFLDTN